MEKMEEMEEMEEEEEEEEMEETDKAFIGKALGQCQEPYKWAMYGEWEPLIEFYEKQPDEVVGQLTTNIDTVLHVVAVAGRNDVLRFLIEPIKDFAILVHALSTQNNYGNTILHEVAASGNLDAARLLICKVKENDHSYKRILAIKNSLGETPLYRAAAFGHTNLVKYLDSEVKQQQQQQDIEQQQQQQDIKKQQEKAMEYHFNRKHDNISILQIAVISQHFETALWLLKEYPNLANRKERNGLTCLQLLAQMPYAFEAKFRKSIWKMLIYKWIYPSTDDLNSRINQPSQSRCSQNITRWRPIRDIFDEIKNQKFLSELTHLLVKEDYSWVVSRATKFNTFTLVCSKKSEMKEKTSESTLKQTPLHIATCMGISNIVKKILDSHPQAVEALDPVTQQNILHMAIKHRRLAIFNMLKKSKSIRSRLAYRIDSNGNTILHHAAYVRSYPVDAQRSSGPAFQLQEELRWMARVEKIMPAHYAMHQNKQGLTAQKLFEKEHANLLELAKTWIKGTAQSCSTVAASVATVAYAAAYTTPGGNDDNGVPILRHSPFFITFAVSDTVSLICSLASLGTFLSIMTSQFEYENFHRSLPSRLHLGFTLLFFSLVATMLTFTATVVLFIHRQKTWTTPLIYGVALVPVSVFLLSQFPLYDGFCKSLKYISKEMKPIISSIRRVFGFSQS